MNFYLEQTSKHNPDLDMMFLQNELRVGFDDWQIVTQEQIENMSTLAVLEKLHYYQNIIPVGRLDFVQACLAKIHGVLHMNPIEVPEILRTPEFLGRRYSIRDFEDLPKSGRYFIKDVTKLKGASVITDISRVPHDYFADYYHMQLAPNHLYQVSDIIEPISEYRVFVHDDKIIAIHHYDGCSTVLPDVHQIRDMVSQYSLDKGRPRAYSMDVAVAYQKGTVILEVHPWVSIGLYGYIFESDIRYCYRDGFQYYVEKNHALQPWSNF